MGNAVLLPSPNTALFFFFLLLQLFIRVQVIEFIEQPQNLEDINLPFAAYDLQHVQDQVTTGENY